MNFLINKVSSTNLKLLTLIHYIEYYLKELDCSDDLSMTQSLIPNSMETWAPKLRDAAVDLVVAMVSRDVKTLI